MLSEAQHLYAAIGKQPTGIRGDSASLRLICHQALQNDVFAELLCLSPGEVDLPR
jgi:hypothetical protein